jgi:transcription factor 1
VHNAKHIHKLECEILETNDGQEQKKKHELIAELTEQQENLKDTLANIHKNKCPIDVDEALGLQSPVTRLQWDERPFHPLLVHPDEVWPTSRMSLVDIQPKPVPAGQDVSFLEHFGDFLVALLEKAHLSLPEALEAICPGASEIMAEVPALMDPKKGGRLNMNELRVRMLTLEMVDGLCKAFKEWPFRPEGSDHPRYFSTRLSKIPQA